MKVVVTSRVCKLGQFKDLLTKLPALNFELTTATAKELKIRHLLEAYGPDF